MDILPNFAIPGIAFLLTLASGFWLSSIAKPLNTAIFTIHKLISLGMVILSAVQIFNALKDAPIQALLIVGIGAAGACVLALFATGALMSAAKLNYNLLLWIHRLAPFLLAISLAFSIYLLQP